MVEYNKINFKLSDPLLNKLKTAVKNGRGTNLKENSKFENKLRFFL